MEPFKTIRTKIPMNGFQLKIIAIITMFIDHLAAGHVEKILRYPSPKEGLPSFYGNFLTKYGEVVIFWMRSIGRIAFPLFCFLLVEGFLHTRDIKKYLQRLFLFALISELPFNLAFYDQRCYRFHQNIFFTLFLGILMLTIMERYGDFLPFGEGLIVLVFCIIGTITFVDYSFMGILPVYLFYKWGKTPNGRVKAGLVGFLFEAPTLVYLSLIPIFLYGGKRGRNWKIFFYLFYPLHLLLIYAYHRWFLFHYSL